ncbi:MAG: site-specific integrase [Deltaproteobacteria bacterium]|nr:site-specific integrase [Deltaproteobacteria bacterium]
MAVKWYKVGKGLQATDHETRKHGKRFDRYIRARFRVEGKTQVFGLGWESEWILAEKARMLREGETGPRRSFLDYCQGELARLKQNALRGSGPVTPKEEREVNQAKAEAQEKARNEEERKALTFGEYWENHYFPAAKTNKPKSYKAEKSLYGKWIRPNISKLKMADLRPLHVEGIKRKMLKADKSPRTIQLVLAIARQCWNHARNNGVVYAEWPGKSVKAPKFDNRRMRFLTKDESDKLLAKLKKTSQQVHDMALLSLETGMRAGEIFTLDWEHVDLASAQIRVVDTKGGENRIAYMTKKVKTMLLALPERKGKAFPPRQGETIGQVSKTFMRCVDALELNSGVTDERNKVTFHTCRHTFASRLVQAGTDLYTVKELLGHSTIALTERYSHLAPENMQAAIKVLDEEPEMAEVVPIVKSEDG